MKRIAFLYFVGTCFVLSCLTSCYAFLKADKLVYAGTMAKKPVTVQVDSIYNVNVDIDE